MTPTHTPPLARRPTCLGSPLAFRFTMRRSLTLPLALPLTLALSVALLSPAPAQAEEVQAAEVRLEPYTVTGARGDALLIKPVGAAGDVRTKTQSTTAAAAFDPLRGLSLDPTREAVIGAADGARAAVRVRARGPGGGVGAKAAGQAGATAIDAGRADDAQGNAVSRSDAASQGDAVSQGNEGDAVSPVYVDAAGHARALPGGVIVTFRDGIDREAARAAIEASGHRVQRELAPGIWLIDTDTGEAAVETARILAANGAFRSVEPNWWREPVRK